jgi:nucleotide-binding universal stress UspA family protein
MRPKRVVAAVDFSTATAVVVEAAASLARAFGATVDVLHVREPVRDTLKRLTLPPTDTGPHEEIDRALDALVEQLVEQGIAAVSTSLDGIPSKRIVEHARKTGSDLILLASHGRTGAAHALLGGVAERVAQHASCAVLILPLCPGREGA